MIKILESCMISVSIQRGIWEVHGHSRVATKTESPSIVNPVFVSIASGGILRGPEESSMSFENRMARLPTLGIGVSTEYGAFESPGSLDIRRLRQEYPQFAGFLEVGVELHKGLDQDAVEWAKAELPTTYHFLDINLDEANPFPPNGWSKPEPSSRPFGLRGCAGMRVCGIWAPVNLAP